MIKSSRILSIFLISILLTAIVLPLLKLNSTYVYAQDFQLVDTLWGSRDNPREVYPGSKDVTLIVLIVNNYKKLISVSGVLTLPNGITDIYGSNTAKATGFVRENNTITQHVDEGETFEFDFRLDIGGNLNPGTYYGDLTIRYEYFEGGTLKTGSYTISSIPLKISNFPQVGYSIDNIYWMATDGSYINATPGARDLELSIDLRNIGECDLTNVKTYLQLPKGFKPSKVSYTIGNLGRGDLATITFTGIYVDYNLKPGIYKAKLRIEATFQGYGGASKTYYNSLDINLKISKPQNLTIAIVSIGWNGLDTLYRGSREVNLDITIRNIGFYRINSLNIYLHLPDGFTTAAGLHLVNYTFNRVLDYGDTATLSIGPIYASNITPGIYNFTLEAYGLISVGNTILKAYYNSTIHLRVSSYNSNLVITSIEYDYNNQPSPLLPGSKAIEIKLRIANRGLRDISALGVKVKTPDGFKIYGITIPNGDIPASTAFTLAFYVNVSNWVKPGKYPFNISLSYIVDPNGARAIDIFKTTIYIEVSNPEIYKSNIVIANAYWGVNQPIEVYPGSKFNQLTITLLNKGPYDARSLRVVVEAPDGFTITYTTSSTLDILRTLEYSRLTFYVNISKSVNPGDYRFNMSIYYMLSIYGSDIPKRLNTFIYVRVSRPPAGLPYIKIVDYDWENGYNVYPNTKKARLVVTIADESPYSVSGINATLILPNGFERRGSRYVHSYIAGPINSWQTATLTFEFNIGNVSPGFYNVTLIIRYLLNSGGGGLSLTDVYKLSIRISHTSGVQYITSYWLYNSAGPGAAGIYQIVVLRNIEFDRMYGIIAEVILPDGVISTITGGKVFNITPYIASSSQQITQLITSIRAGRFTIQPTQVQGGEARKGDFIIIPMTLNFKPDIKPGVYDYKIILSFLDEWNTERSININARMWVLGRTENIIVLENKSVIFISSRRSKIVLYLYNNGSGPMYDVRVSLSSLSSAISFSSAVKYIPVMKPRQVVKLVWYAAPATSSYIGSIPALVTISYVDPAGNMMMFNQTVILYVEGIAELKLIDVSIEPNPPYAMSKLTISATIVNIGTDTARNTEVFIKSNKYLDLDQSSYSFVGDIDKGSQMPITLYAYVKNYTGDLNITIVVRFMNAYYESVKYEFPITIHVFPKPTAKKQVTILGLPGEEFTWRLIITICVIAFLIISLILIYKNFIAGKSTGGI